MKARLCKLASVNTNIVGEQAPNKREKVTAPFDTRYERACSGKLPPTPRFLYENLTALIIPTPLAQCNCPKSYTHPSFLINRRPQPHKNISFFVSGGICSFSRCLGQNGGDVCGPAGEHARGGLYGPREHLRHRGHLRGRRTGFSALRRDHCSVR